jgi:hypothetical protein
LVRAGGGAIAVTVAALTIGFNVDMRSGYGVRPATAGLRTHGVSVFGTIHPELFQLGPTGLGLEIPDSDVRLASLEAGNRSDLTLGPDEPSEPPAAADRATFGDRFTFDVQPAVSFDDRFGGAISPAAAPVQSAMAEPGASVPPVAASAPRATARVALAAPARKRMAAPKVQLASLSDDPLPTAYAPSDSAPKNPSLRDLLLKDIGPKDSGPKDSTPKDSAPKDSNPLSDVDTSRTAIYDITAHTVYLPNGQRLEAHSGLGSRMDNPRYVNLKMHGPTPPNVYELKLRESPFHGVRALRLNPIDETRMYGRDGILAHTYMLGPNGQSNGCVSFSDYQAFLDAYLRGEVDRLVVVERLAAPPASRTASGWLANALKDIFRRS